MVIGMGIVHFPPAKLKVYQKSGTRLWGISADPPKRTSTGQVCVYVFFFKDQAVCALNADPVCPRPRISEPFQAPSLEADARTRYKRAGHKGQGQRQGQGPRAAARCDGGHAGTPNMSNSNQIKS